MLLWERGLARLGRESLVALALVLAMVGLYGITSYAVARLDSMVTLREE